MRPLDITYLFLCVLTTAGALRVLMKTQLLSAQRDQDISIPCDVFDLKPGSAIAVLWTQRQEDGTVRNVYEYEDGVINVYRPGCKMEKTDILKGNASLFIPRVQFSDDGQYICKVINTPNKDEGTAALQVSAPPSAEVFPQNPTIELETEKTMMCEVHNFYPKDITVRWAQYRAGSSDCDLEIWTCVKNILPNADGTFNVTSLLTLIPKKEDDGNTFSCIVSHRSLQTELSKNFTLKVTEREDNSGAVVRAVVGTLVVALSLGLLGFLYMKFIKEDPPSLSEITGNNELIDMNRTTLFLQIMGFRPNNIEIIVCIRRSNEEEMRTIYTWRSGGPLTPARMIRDDGQVVLDMEEERTLMNGSAGHEDRPLQLVMESRITGNRFSSFSCQCTLHITPSYDLDNGAELSVYVKHPALSSPASVKRTLNVIGVSPKLLSIMSPERVIHDEQVTLTCPINGFKPKSLSITWLKRIKDQEIQLVTWIPGSDTTNNGRYLHSVKEHEHDDKSFSIISALTMKATVTEDDGVTYICRTFHPATNHCEERELVIKVFAVPVLDPIVKTPEVVSVNKEMKLSCRVSLFYPRPIQVTWKKEDVLLSSNISEILQTDSICHMTSSTSYTPTMNDLGKTFRCEVQHESLSKPKHVTWTLKDIASPPTLGDIEGTPENPEPGKPLTLSCMISDMYPKNDSIQWYQGLTKFNIEQWNENIQQDPESKMFCGTTELTLTERPTSEIRLEIIHNGTPFTKEYRLHMKGLPQLSDISCDPERPDYGRPVTLRCDVTGCNPDDITEVTWSESGGEVVGEKRKTRGSAGVLSCYLTITPTAQDYGKNYKCSVTHKGMAAVTKQKYLKLPERSPKLSDIIPNPDKVTANQKTSFTVTISGFCPRDLIIKWYKEFNTFPNSDVTTSDVKIGADFLYQCSSTLTFTPRMSDHEMSIRCEVTRSHSKAAVQEKRYTLCLAESTPPKSSVEENKTIDIKKITCMTAHPRAGKEVTLVAYIEGCETEDAEFTWYNGMYIIDGEIENKQDGTSCTSTITFTLDKSDTECRIKLEVFYNLQTAEKPYTLRLI